MLQVGTSAAVMIITQTADYMMTLAAAVIKTPVVVVIARLIRDWMLVEMELAQKQIVVKNTNQKSITLVINAPTATRHMIEYQWEWRWCWIIFPWLNIPFTKLK